MSERVSIEIFGKAEVKICAGCEGHSCNECSPGEKEKTIDLVKRFENLLKESEFAQKYTVSFYESTPENIAKYPDVQKLLSMADLEPVICMNGKIKYLGGFSPEGLLDELKKFPLE